MNNKKFKILVVDDNELIRKLLDIFLTDCGFHVTNIDNALDAACSFMDEEFDLVITDISMPGLNGNILAKSIRNLDKKIPLFAIRADPASAGEHFDLVIAKPFKLKSIIAAIKPYVDEV